MKVSRLVALVAGPLALSAVVACGGGSAPQAAAPVAVPPVDVAAVTAAAGTLEATLELSGNLTPRAAILAWLLATGYGVTDEVHQRFVPFRTADVADLAADALGAAAAAMGGLGASGIIARSRGGRPPR